MSLRRLVVFELAKYEIDLYFLAGNDWFCFFDIMHQHIMHTQTYTTMAYLPYNFVATHLYFAASNAAGRAKITYPTQGSIEATSIDKDFH